MRLQAGGGDKVAAPDGQSLGPGEPRKGRPGCERNGDHRVFDARTQRGHQGQGQDQLWKGKKDVGHPHQDLVERAPA